MKTSEKQDHAPEVEEAEEVLGLVLPTSGEPTPAFEPSEEALDFPAPLVAAQFAEILRTVALGTADSLRGDEVDTAFHGETATQGATVPGFVRNQSRRQLMYESSVESSLGEHTVESVSSINMDSDWKTMAVCHCHDLGGIARAAAPDAGPPFFAGTYVPSMNPSTSAMPPRFSKSRRSAANTLGRTPFFTHA